MLIKEAFDVAEDIMKQCTIAKYRYQKNRTSVNQKRLEVLSVRSVRVVLGSIERVNEVCHLLKSNYTKLHQDSSMMQQEDAEDQENKNPSPNRRAHSAPMKRPVIADIQNASSRPIDNSEKRRNRRPQSAFTRRVNGKHAFTANSKASGGSAPYRRFSTHMKDSRSPSPSAKAVNEGRNRNDIATSAQDDMGIYSDDDDLDNEIKENGTDDQNVSGGEVVEERGRHRVRKVKKKSSKGIKHTCAQCSEQFRGDGKLYPFVLLNIHFI